MNLIKKVFSSEIKSIDEANMELTALVSTNAIDRYKEVIDPDGMDAKNFRKNPVVLWAHDYSQPPIGKALWIKKEGDGIVSKVKFANTPRAKEVFELYKDGFMKAFSIGFMPIETVDGDMENPKSPRRTYKKWELLEYSAVPVPANPEAVALCIKRGLITDEEAPAILQRGFNVDDWNEETEQKESEEDTENNMDDLFTEIDSLKAQTDELTRLLKDKDVEIGKLNLYIYNLNLTIKKLNENPGITADELGKRIVDIAGGVIRKHLGKVE